MNKRHNITFWTDSFKLYFSLTAIVNYFWIKTFVSCIWRCNTFFWYSLLLQWTNFSIFRCNYLENSWNTKQFCNSFFSPKYVPPLKLVSAIFIKFLFFHQMIVLQKLSKMLFILSKKVFSFSRYSIFCISIFPSFSPCGPLL